jgi:hypothetical protein
MPLGGEAFPNVTYERFLKGRRFACEWWEVPSIIPTIKPYPVVQLSQQLQHRIIGVFFLQLCDLANLTIINKKI